MATRALQADTEGMENVRADCSILVLHDQHTDPRAFLQRLIASPLSADSTGTGSNATHTPERKARAESEAEGYGGRIQPVEWVIDNKYYTAAVHFVCRDVGHVGITTSGKHGDGSGHGYDDGEVPVVMYLFTGQPPDPLPPALTRLMAGSPRDIALAVRIRPDGAPPGAADGQEGEAVRPGRSELEVEEAFDELGMELIDEDAGEEEDEMQGLGERSVSPLEQIRQTLQTHLWPNMVRKPLLSTRQTTSLERATFREGAEATTGRETRTLIWEDSDSSLYSDDGHDEDDDDFDGAAAPAGPAFPVTFGQTGTLRNGDINTPHLGLKGQGIDSHDDALMTNNNEHDIDDDDDDNDDHLDDPTNLFPSLAALRAQVSAAAAPNLPSASHTSAYAGLLAMNEQLALANREFAQVKLEREMLAERRLERLERLERKLDGDSSDDDDDDDDDGDGVYEDEDDEDGARVISFGNGGHAQGQGEMSGSSRISGLQMPGMGEGIGGAGSGPSRGEWERLEEWLSLDREQVLQDPNTEPLKGLMHGEQRAGEERRASIGRMSGDDDSDTGGDEDVDEWCGEGYAMLDGEEDGGRADVIIDGGSDGDISGRAGVPRQAGEDNGFGDFVSTVDDGAPDSEPKETSAAAPGPVPAGQDGFTVHASAEASSSHPPFTHTNGLSFEDNFDVSPSASTNKTAKSGTRKPRKANPTANGPSDTSSNFAPLPLDPTPLLLHLQSIRAELAGVEDEDERRVRAAREVGGLMRSLGVEGWDEGDLEGLDDEDGADMGLLRGEGDLGRDLESLKMEGER